MAFVSVMVFLALVAEAAEPRAVAPGWILDTWDHRDGLPVDLTYEAATDRDGLLWIATTDGLVRFDGVAFETFRAGHPLGPTSSRVFTIVAHPADGALWAITEDLTAQRRDGADLTVFPERLQESPSPGADALWVHSSAGLIEITADGYHTLDRPLHGAATVADAGGSVWTLHGDALWELPSGEGSWRTFPGVLPGECYPARAADDGGLVCFSEAGVHRWEPEQRAFVLEEGLQHVDRRRPPDPTPWSSAGQAITHQGVPLVTLTHPISNLHDGGDQLWITTGGAGLMRLRPALVRSHRAPDGAPTNVQRLWWEDETRTLWAQGAAQGWWPVHTLAEPPPPLPSISPDGSAACPPPARRFFRGPDGARWVACNHEVLRHTASGWQDVGAPPRAAAGPVRQLGGAWWFGGDRTPPMVLRSGRWEVIHTTAGDHASVSAIWPLDSGEVLLGGPGGLHRVAPSGAESAALPEGTSARSPVRDIRGADGMLWIATVEQGLCAVEEAALGEAPLRCLGEASTLGRRTVHSSLADNHGRVWVSSNQGIGVADAAQLDAWARGAAQPPPFLWLGASAGLSNPECNGFMGDAAVVTPDGMLWFATQDGVAQIDPATVALPSPPSVVWLAPTVGDAPQHLVRDLDLPTDHGAVQLRWTTAAVPLAEQAEFRYRIDDGEWSAPSTERSITFPVLPPGSHTVAVQARLGGSWGPAATVALRRAPALYERSIFPVLVGAGLLLAAVGVLVARQRFLTGLNQQLQAQVAEQTEALAQKNHTLQRVNDILSDKTDTLEQRNNELADRSRVIAAQARQIKQLDVLKRQLIANASHELRTPLSLILAPLSATLGDDTLSAASRKNIGLAVENADHLQRLIGQLFELSRAQAGGISLRARRLDLGSFLQELRLRFAPLAEEKDVTLDCVAPSALQRVWLDRDLIDKVLSNLLTNAIRVSPPGGALFLRLHPRGEDVLVEVEDEGPGVPDAQKAQVFERFFQTGSASARGGGGLGLTLSRELVELHGGQIGVRDGQRGACFWFSLPLGTAHLAPHEITLDEQAPHVPSPAPPADDSATRPAVLLVEDHPQLRAFLAESLAGHFDVHAAEDGLAALAALEAGLAPALVISDIMMPGMDGHALARRLRAQRPALPLLFISARQELADRVEGLELADDYLPKPFQIPELIARATALLRRRGAPSADAPPPSETPAARLAAALREAATPRLGEKGFNAGALAKAVAMSPRTLQLRMQEHSLPPPGEWLRALRLERGQALLQSGRFSTVGEVAAEIGLSRVYFSRLYRAQLGRPPGEDLQKAPV